MRKKLITLAKIICFLLLLGISVKGAETVLQPVWKDWHNYDTMNGFYQEPDQTMQVIFLGSSMVVNGIIPTDLYEDFGICAYNLGTEQQPVMGSYYLMQEAYKHHTSTLKLVVLDASMLRRDPIDELYQKIYSGMEPSMVKWSFIHSHVMKTAQELASKKQGTGNQQESMAQEDRSIWATQSESIEKTIPYMVPLFTYHNRWPQLWKQDFEKQSFSPNCDSRGYNASFDFFYNIADLGNLPITELELNHEAESAQFSEESLYYFDQMVAFCKENGLQLLLMKTPTVDHWESESNIAAQKLADSYGVDFVDLSYEPVLSALDFHHALDMMDSSHLNYYGATKVTSAIGGYIKAHFDLADVRGKEKYAYLEAQSASYQKVIEATVSLKKEQDPASYLEKAMQMEDCMVFLSVQESAASAMEESQREAFAEIGLPLLAKLEEGDSYLTVVESGSVCKEARASYETGEVVIREDGAQQAKTQSKAQSNGYFSELKDNEPLEVYGETPDGVWYQLLSGGLDRQKKSSCGIDEISIYKSSRGLHIVVYDFVQQQVRDVAGFDLEVTSSRTVIAEDTYQTILKALEKDNSSENQIKLSQKYGWEYRKMYLYEKRCMEENLNRYAEANLGQDGFLEFLDLYGAIPNCTIYVAVYDEAANGLDRDSRIYLVNQGFRQVQNLQFRDSFLAVIEDGKLVFEQRDHGSNPIGYQDGIVKMMSAGKDSGNMVSIVVKGEDYAPGNRGFNLVVYDRDLEKVIKTGWFDTMEDTPKIPEKKGDK